MALEGLNRLQVYQDAMNLAMLVYQEVIPNLPSEEKWGLSSQIRRAAASIPANIAEGYGRYYYQEGVRFSYLARGSLMELSSHIELATSQGYLSEESQDQFHRKMSSLLRLIHGYINYLRQSKRGCGEPGSQKISEYPLGIYNDSEDTSKNGD